MPTNEGKRRKKEKRKEAAEMEQKEKTIGQIVRENQHFKTLYVDDLIDYYEEHKSLNRLKEEVAVIKNYKIMCELLKEKEEAGNSKKAQQKEWKRYIDFEREGQKYIIKEIYDIPLPEGSYNNPINTFNEFLICLYINECNKKYPKQRGLICGKTKLAEKLGLINERYTEYRDKKNRIVYELQIDDEEYLNKVDKLSKKEQEEEFTKRLNIVNKVYEDLPHKYKYRLEKAIENLSKRSLVLREIVYYGEKIVIDIKDTTNVYEIFEDNIQIDKYGDKYQDGYKMNKEIIKNVTVPLTDKEKEEYLKIGRRIRRSYLKKNAKNENEVCETIRDLYDLGINPITKKAYIDEYYERLNNEIKKMGYKAIFEAYRLYFHPEYIEDESWKLLNKLECIEENNKLFLEKTIKNVENKAKREIKKIEEKDIDQKEKNKRIKEIEEDRDYTTTILEKVIYRDKLNKNNIEKMIESK